MGYATIGMIKAFHSYDASKRFKFITYASRIMINEILMQFRKAEHKKKKVSLDAPTSNDSESDLSLLDVLQDTSIAFESIVEQKELVKLILQETQTLLTEKEYIIVANILAVSPKNQRELSVDLGFAQSYVSRLEAKALKKIRDYLINKETANEKKPYRREVQVVMSQPLEPGIYVEGKTLLEKVRYIVAHYPEMSTEDIANEIKSTKSTVATYVSQVRRESRNEPSLNNQTVLKENQSVSLPTNKEIQDENYRLKGALEEAINKMLASSEEKDALSKELEDSKFRIERLDQLNYLLMGELVELRLKLKKAQ